MLTLDYPNQEVINSLARLFLDNVYQVEGYLVLGSKLWNALKEGDMRGIVRLYNTALACIPYDDFTGQKESFYRSLFMMLLSGAGIIPSGEVHTHRGRTDVLVQLPGRIVVLEFKLARRETEVASLRKSGEKQIREKGYVSPYSEDQRPVTSAVIVINAKKHEATI